MLQHWPEPFASPADHAACRVRLAGGSRSFLAASRLLPDGMHEPATSLYAFCRDADDAIDLARDAAEREAALHALHRRLDRAYAGDPLPSPVDRVLADLVREVGIPRALPDALIEGFAWDAEGRRYPDLDGVYAYGARVAGSVGAMMALIMGARRPALLSAACDLGVAMQLTNIARDVGEDARAGRLYLPLRWLEEAGIDARSFLARPAFSPSLGAVVARLLDAADLLYARALPGIAGLPPACRPGIHAARLLYAAIGTAVRRRGCDSVSTRAVVPAATKLRLAGDALLAAALPSREPPAPPLPAVRFLIDAASCRPPASYDRSLSRGPEAKLLWVLGLFDRLERRERFGPAPLLGSGNPAI